MDYIMEKENQAVVLEQSKADEKAQQQRLAALIKKLNKEKKN